MNSSEIQEKVKEYENFVELVLKNDLKEIESSLNNKVLKFKDWEEVKQMAAVIKEFKENERDMLVKLDLGQGIMVDGEICDYQDVYVNVGLGVLLEMDCEEATKYADIRLRLLQKEITHFRKLAVNVKVNIKMVLLAINELGKSILK